MGFVTWLRV